MSIYNVRFTTLKFGRRIAPAALLLAAQMMHAQGILNTNLIVNGDAESGSAGTATTTVASIPGWTRTGNANVLPYNLTGYVLLSDPAPPDHGFQYFTGPLAGVSSTLTQTINVSSGASTISGGNVKYTFSAYLGAYTGGVGVPVQVTAAFQNASGQTFSSATVGPAGYNADGMSMQQQIGLVPSGTVQILVTLTLSDKYAAADSLSLVLTTLGTSPGAVLGANLIANGGAEAGPSAPHTANTLYIPGWSTADGVSVAPYGGTGWILATDPGPADRAFFLSSVRLQDRRSAVPHFHARVAHFFAFFLFLFLALRRCISSRLMSEIFSRFSFTW
jgi:hypothetical protein